MYISGRRSLHGSIHPSLSCSSCGSDNRASLNEPVYLHRFAPNKKPQPLPVGVLVLRLFYVRPYASGHQSSPGNAGARKPIKVVACKGQMPAPHDVQCYTLWLVMSITMGFPAGPCHCRSQRRRRASAWPGRALKDSFDHLLRRCSGGLSGALSSEEREFLYLRDTLRLPAEGLSPSALPIFHQLARRCQGCVALGWLQ